MRRRSLSIALLLCACNPARPAPPDPPPAPPPEPAPAPAAPPAPPAPPEPAADTTRCTCPTEPLPAEPAEPDGAEDDDVPEDLQARRARARKQLPKPLTARLRAALPDHRPACDVVAAGPCSLTGDFDGDGQRDDAVLVRSIHNAGGIAVLWASGGSELLGAGRHQCWTTTEQANLDGSPTANPCLEAIDADLVWISRWELLTRTPGTPPLLHRPTHKPGKHGHPAPDALGDALLLDGGDAAAALYRTRAGWTLMHLGY